MKKDNNTITILTQQAQRIVKQNQHIVHNKTEETINTLINKDR